VVRSISDPAGRADRYVNSGPHTGNTRKKIGADVRSDIARERAEPADVRTGCAGARPAIHPAGQVNITFIIRPSPDTEEKPPVDELWTVVGAPAGR